MSYLKWVEKLAPSIGFFDPYQAEAEILASGSHSITIPTDSGSRVETFFRIMKDGKSDAESWATSNSKDFASFATFHDKVEEGFVSTPSSFQSDFILAHSLLNEINDLASTKGDITSTHIDTQLSNL